MQKLGIFKRLLKRLNCVHSVAMKPVRHHEEPPIPVSKHNYQLDDISFHEKVQTVVTEEVGEDLRIHACYMRSTPNYTVDHLSYDLEETISASKSSSSHVDAITIQEANYSTSEDGNSANCYCPAGDEVDVVLTVEEAENSTKMASHLLCELGTIALLTIALLVVLIVATGILITEFIAGERKDGKVTVTFHQRPATVLKEQYVQVHIHMQSR